MTVLRATLLVGGTLMLCPALPAWSQPLKEVPSYALKRGDHAPPLGFERMAQGPDARAVSWRALRGKVVVLDFWGTWCPPCVAGLPHLNDLVGKYEGKPVQFIAVGHENQARVSWFLKKHPIAAWVGLDTDVSMFKSFTAFGIPQAVIVDKKGVVAAVLATSDLSEAVIDDVIAGRKPTHPPLTPAAYWNPKTAEEFFLKTGQEPPPVD